MENWTAPQRMTLSEAIRFADERDASDPDKTGGRRVYVDWRGRVYVRLGDADPPFRSRLVDRKTLNATGPVLGEKMKITPIDQGGDYRTGRLNEMTVALITVVLGFDPNHSSDPDKVVNSWGFIADGKRCGIWDYKGSHEFGQFSTFGPKEIFETLFPNHYTHEGK